MTSRIPRAIWRVTRPNQAYPIGTPIRRDPRRRAGVFVLADSAAEAAARGADKAPELVVDGHVRVQFWLRTTDPNVYVRMSHGDERSEQCDG